MSFQAPQAFDRVPALYDRIRPDYPAEVVDWLVEALGLQTGETVVDLAAGTGKLTKALLARARARVIAVEPSIAMLDRLREVAPAAEAVEGTAEAIPLPDASADAVTVAQAFHWFANDDALTEIHRVLRPGRRLALLWNRRVLEAPAHAAMNELLVPYETPDVPRHKSGEWRRAMEATERFKAHDSKELPWVQHVDRAGLVDRFASTSFIAALDPAEHERALARARDVASGFAEPIDLPHVAEVFVYARV
jgi:ubiquinone/menaquinone biosynthesis C-methylase UbiE